MPRLEKPHVELYVFYTPIAPTLTPPEMPACIVGPCYQVVRDALGGEWMQEELTFAYPNLDSGTVVDEDNVSLTLTDEDQNSYTLPYTYISGKTASDLYVDGGVWKLEFVSSTSDLDIVAGDKVYITNPVVPKNNLPNGWTVASSSVSDIGDGDYLVTLTSTESATDSNNYPEATFDLKICVPTINSTGVVIPARTSSQVLPPGNVTITYRAMYTNKNRLYQINSESDITDILGGRDILNPLGYAVGLAYDNAVTSVYAFGVSSDDETGHAEAREELELHDVYAIVPLTENETIKQAYKTHVESMSLPTNKMERITVLGTQPPVDYKTITETPVSDAIITELGNNQALLTCGLSTPKVGDYVEITAPSTAAGTFKVVNTSGTDLIIAATFGISQSGVQYDVKRPTTKVEKRDAQASYAASFGSKRVIVVFPYILLSGDTELKSYYGAAAVAGMISGIMPQVPLSNTSIAGFDGRIGSNDYYTEMNLDYIAGGGNFILVQETTGAPLVIRHQLTTDTTDLNTREVSRVHNVDYCAKFFRAIVKPYLGKYNVTDELETILKMAVHGGIEYLKRQRVPRAGSIIRTGTLKGMKLETDTVTMEIEVGIGYPFNVGIINLYVS